MNTMKRILTFFSLFFIYLILKEFLQLYSSTHAIHPYLGYGTLILIAAFCTYFIILPVIRIIKVPQTYAPVRDKNKIPQLLETRFKRFETNPVILISDIQISNLSLDQNGYNQAMQALEPEAAKIRKNYVTQVFYSTAIAQNGFLDAILILSACVNMVKDLFMLYQGRVYNRDLWKIARMVYYSMAIGGSETVEYAADEVVSKLFSGGMKGVPFASKVLGSLADGFVNAALITRICLITENYCKMLYIEKERDLYPSYKTVIETTRILTSDIIDRILHEVKSMAKESSNQFIETTINPVKYIMEKAISSVKLDRDISKEDYLKTSSSIVYNPIGFMFQKITGIFKP